MYDYIQLKLRFKSSYTNLFFGMYDYIQLK